MKKFNVTVNGKSYAVEVEEVGGFTYQPAAAPAPVAPAPQAASAPVAPAPAPKAPKVAPAPAPKAPSGPVEGETIVGPMPGTILDIRVTEGQKVKAGDILVILEAMKMENEIVAPTDGVVNKIHTSKQAIINTGDPLVTIG